MSFYQRSAWACFLSTLVVWGAYLAFTLSLSAEMSGIAIPAMIGAIVLQTIVMIATHIVFAVMHRRETGFDERDRSIAVRSGHWAGVLLSVGVFACAIFFPVREIALRGEVQNAWTSGAMASPFATANLLLAWFVLSELVHYGAQIVLYRRS